MTPEERLAELLFTIHHDERFTQDELEEYVVEYNIKTDFSKMLEAGWIKKSKQKSQLYTFYFLARKPVDFSKKRPLSKPQYYKLGAHYFLPARLEKHFYDFARKELNLSHNQLYAFWGNDNDAIDKLYRWLVKPGVFFASKLDVFQHLRKHANDIRQTVERSIQDTIFSHPGRPYSRMVDLLNYLDDKPKTSSEKAVFSQKKRSVVEIVFQAPDPKSFLTAYDETFAELNKS